jgi:hypothetical protein
MFIVFFLGMFWDYPWGNTHLDIPKAGVCIAYSGRRNMLLPLFLFLSMFLAHFSGSIGGYTFFFLGIGCTITREAGMGSLYQVFDAQGGGDSACIFRLGTQHGFRFGF